jgi:formyltetrahydrofolate deformylase
MSKTATLLIHCPDKPGIVSGVSTFLYEQGANILHADQHQDNDRGLFFMRVQWEWAGFKLDEEEFENRFTLLTETFQMQWHFTISTQVKNVAIFVSHFLHGLVDLLYRHAIGELHCNIPLIISNHSEAEKLADFYKIPFYHFPVTQMNKDDVEAKQLKLLDEHDIDLIVLARYMQVLSPAFVNIYPQRIINVHHSFLPAFGGARPYQAAFQRGVKIIGATSHYVTAELDEGPIIEQDVVRISHRDQVEDLVQKGRDLERVVLSRAVKWHLENRILLYDRKTVVFD